MQKKKKKKKRFFQANAVFEKSIENVRKHRQFVTNEVTKNYLVLEPN